MRIALLHYSYAPVIGGVERVIQAHAELFSGAVHEVTVLCGRGADSQGDVRVKVLPELQPGATAEQVAAALRPLLSSQDIVFLHNVLTMHFHLELTQALWRLASELREVRWFAWVHDLAAQNPDYTLPSEAVEPWALLSRAHPRVHYVAVSELRRGQFLELTRAAHCAVIPNGVDADALLNLTPAIARLAAQHCWLERDSVLLVPCRLLRRKNVELALTVTAELASRGHSVACLITAPPDVHNEASRLYAEELWELRTQLGLHDSVFFLAEIEPLSADDLRSLYQAADALFYPSRQEGFGIPVLEAAALRVPIFCAHIEPLTVLLATGVKTFPPDAAPSAVAELLVSTLAGDAAACARKEVFRRYLWNAIHRNCLSALLSESETYLPMNLQALPSLDPGTIDAIRGAYHGDPFAILGLHQVGEQLVVRVFRPDAKELAVREVGGNGRSWPAQRIHEDGLFEALLEGTNERVAYELALTGHEGREWVERDPYSFGVILGQLDLHLFAEGQHWRLYDKLGAHIMEVDGVRGSAFHVWAPNAQRVSVIGDFNQWDGRRAPMRKLLGCGVWEIFLPGVGEGAHYKFELKQSHGGLAVKSDPFAFYGQHGLQTASMVFDLGRFRWSDEEWINARKGKEWHREPISVYEVHLGSWRRKVEEGNRFLSYRELADELLDYVVHLGYTHIELLPVAEHPFEGSWGYQVTGYFAPTSRFGNPDEFRYFVDTAHQKGIGIILDWVPGHFPKDAHGLAEFDGTDLYEHADPRKGEHMDWGTLIFNYGRNEVRNFLIANALFWLEEYHIDGLRVDAVASMLYLDYSRKHGEWEPNIHGGRENLEAIYFLKRFNEVCYERCPGIMTIAEESTAWPGVSRPTYLGGLGFGLKWNMGWMHDFLAYMELDPIYRRFHQGNVTFSLVYAFHEQFVLVLSHDEVVHGKGSLINKMPGDVWQKFANLRMFYAWMYAHPGKKLLFMGGEFGQWREWNHDLSLDWHLTNVPEHDGLMRLVQHLNWLYKNEPALYDQDDTYAGFEWIDFHDSDNSVLAFMRKSRDGEIIAFAVNATPMVREAYRIGVSGGGWYEEILNTDAQTYGGANIGNYGGQYAEETAWQGKSHSLLLRLPPLAVVGFKRLPAPVEPAENNLLETSL